jgi:hypothetical protein
LPFTLPCKELFWCVYKLDTIKDKFTNFTDDAGTNSINSMVTDIQLQFNTKNVFSSKALDNNYFNYVQAYNYHKGCPDLGINCFSFAIKPEEHSPSGFINFSRLSTAVMNITSSPNGFIHIFTMSYNVLKIENGEISLVYNY